MANDDESFEAFLQRREVVSGEYINGRVDGLIALSTHNNPATFFPPSGTRVDGADNVNAANRSGASAFRQGSTGRFEILQSGSDGALGFWTGIQHAEAMLTGKDEPVSMQLRVTEVFRREADGWKLVHRHADPLKS
jgi:ketosteroid isomerase-like protein